MSGAQATIAAMITPALLILACGSLLATALVRIGRIVDRIRALGALADAPKRDLARYERRAALAERAIAAFFAAVVAIVAAGVAIALDRLIAGFGWAPIALTLIGMALITFGAAAMAAESRLAAQQIRMELATLHARES